MRRIDDLTEMAAREKGRLASPALTTSARRSVTRAVRWLEKEAARLRAAADELVGSTEALRIDRVILDVFKGGTREELREVDRNKQIELLPQRTWQALSTEWDALPDLSAQSGTAAMRMSGELMLNRVEVSRYIEAEVEGK